MKRQRVPFAASEDSSPDAFYDLIEDYELIEASFAQQYGIRLRYEDGMSWGEFVTLLGGLNENTPLGKAVSIRAEDDPEVLKHFTPRQRSMRSQWRTRQAKRVGTQEFEFALEGFREMFRSMAGGG